MSLGSKKIQSKNYQGYLYFESCLGPQQSIQTFTKCINSFKETLKNLNQDKEHTLLFPPIDNPSVDFARLFTAVQLSKGAISNKQAKKINIYFSFSNKDYFFIFKPKWLKTFQINIEDQSVELVKSKDDFIQIKKENSITNFSGYLKAPSKICANIDELYRSVFSWPSNKSLWSLK